MNVKLVLGLVIGSLTGAILGLGAAAVAFLLFPGEGAEVAGLVMVIGTPGGFFLGAAFGVVWALRQKDKP